MKMRTMMRAAILSPSLDGIVVFGFDEFMLN